MSKGEITPKSEISKLLSAKPVLPGENADEYAAGLAVRSADYLGCYQQSERQPVPAAMQDANRQGRLTPKRRHVSRDMHVEFKRDNAFRCERRASKKYQQKFFYKRSQFRIENGCMIKPVISC